MKKALFSLLILALWACQPQEKETDQTATEETTKSEEPAKPKEDVQYVDVSKFNQELASMSEALSPEAIMKKYYPHEAGEEGNESVNINQTQLDNGNTEVTLIHDNMLDDAVKATKLVMELEPKGDQFTVASLKKSFKCRQGRGHADWGAAPCS